MGTFYSEQGPINTEKDYDVVKRVPEGFVVYHKDDPLGFAFFEGYVFPLKNGVIVNTPNANWVMEKLEDYLEKYSAQLQQEQIYRKDYFAEDNNETEEEAEVAFKREDAEKLLQKKTLYNLYGLFDGRLKSKLYANQTTNSFSAIIFLLSLEILRENNKVLKQSVVSAKQLLGTIKELGYLETFKEKLTTLAKKMNIKPEHALGYLKELLNLGILDNVIFDLNSDKEFLEELKTLFTAENLALLGLNLNPDNFRYDEDNAENNLAKLLISYPLSENLLVLLDREKINEAFFQLDKAKLFHQFILQFSEDKVFLTTLIMYLKNEEKTKEDLELLLLPQIAKAYYNLLKANNIKKITPYHLAAQILTVKHLAQQLSKLNPEEVDKIFSSTARMHDTIFDIVFDFIDKAKEDTNYDIPKLDADTKFITQLLYSSASEAPTLTDIEDLLNPNNKTSKRESLSIKEAIRILSDEKLGYKLSDFLRTNEKYKNLSKPSATALKFLLLYLFRNPRLISYLKSSLIYKTASDFLADYTQSPKSALSILDALDYRPVNEKASKAFSTLVDSLINTEELQTDNFFNALDEIINLLEENKHDLSITVELFESLASFARLVKHLEEETSSNTGQYDDPNLNLAQFMASFYVPLSTAIKIKLYEFADKIENADVAFALKDLAFIGNRTKDIAFIADGVRNMYSYLRELYEDISTYKQEADLSELMKKIKELSGTFSTIHDTFKNRNYLEQYFESFLAINNAFKELASINKQLNNVIKDQEFLSYLKEEIEQMANFLLNSLAKQKLENMHENKKSRNLQNSAAFFNVAVNIVDFLKRITYYSNLPGVDFYIRLNPFSKKRIDTILGISPDSNLYFIPVGTDYFAFYETEHRTSTLNTLFIAPADRIFERENSLRLVGGFHAALSRTLGRMLVDREYDFGEEIELLDKVTKTKLFGFKQENAFAVIKKALLAKEKVLESLRNTKIYEHLYPKFTKPIKVSEVNTEFDPYSITNPPLFTATLNIEGNEYQLTLQKISLPALISSLLKAGISEILLEKEVNNYFLNYPREKFANNKDEEERYLVNRLLKSFLSKANIDTFIKNIIELSTLNETFIALHKKDDLRFVNPIGDLFEELPSSIVRNTGVFENYYYSYYISRTIDALKEAGQISEDNYKFLKKFTQTRNIALGRTPRASFYPTSDAIFMGLDYPHTYGLFENFSEIPKIINREKKNLESFKQFLKEAYIQLPFPFNSQILLENITEKIAQQNSNFPKIKDFSRDIIRTPLPAMQFAHNFVSTLFHEIGHYLFDTTISQNAEMIKYHKAFAQNFSFPIVEQLAGGLYKFLEKMTASLETAYQRDDFSYEETKKLDDLVADITSFVVRMGILENFMIDNASPAGKALAELYSIFHRLKDIYNASARNFPEVEKFIREFRIKHKIPSYYSLITPIEIPSIVFEYYLVLGEEEFARQFPDYKKYLDYMLAAKKRILVEK